MNSPSNTFLLSYGAGNYEDYFVLTANMPEQINFAPRALFAIEMGKEVAITATQAIVAQFPEWHLQCDLD